jgi:dipeptidyl aminopeptidase/acylaminoacyl peptidase
MSRSVSPATPAWRSRPLLRRTVLAGGALALLGLPVASSGAQGARTPITQDVYDSWRGIVSPTMSRDGQWVAYTNSPTIGDGTLVVRATAGSTEYTVPRGFTGRPNDRPSASGGFSPAAASFSADGRFVAALVYPTQTTVEAARRDRRRAAEANHTTLALMALPSGEVTTLPRVRSFRFARDGGRFLVYQVEADSANGAGRDSTARPAGARPAGTDSARRPTPRRESGSALVLRTLATGEELRLDDVTSFTLDDTERWLAYAVGDADSTKTGLFLRDLASGTVHALRTGKARYRNLTFDRTATQFAFLEAAHDTIAPARAEYDVWLTPLVTRRNAPPVAVPAVRSRGVAEGLFIPERSRLDFTRDGSALQFALAAPPADSIPADSLTDKAIYDLWHWQDTRLQPTQARQAGQDRNRTWAAIYHPKLRKALRLADDSLPQVQVSDDGKLALAVTSVPYEIEAMWGEGGNDVYLIDATTGARTLVAKRLEGRAQFSPNARFVTWFDKDQWHAWEVATKQGRVISEKISGVRLSQETWSTPSTPAAWGLGGWTTDDRQVLINDRYDVWVVDPRGVQAPRRLTGGVGRSTQHVFRVVSLDPEERTIDPAKPLLLEAFNDVTKASGWYRGSFTDSVPTSVLMAPKRFGTLVKARDAERYLVTRSDYREFPDLWAGESLPTLQRISDAFPEQARYARGNVRLHSWLSADGDSLAGLLYTPDDFDPSKKYPMVVYFYETHSDGLHGYVRPAGRNIVNPTVYNSLGYIVFMPDIKYTDGYPGPSAYKSVVPGVQSLIQAGFVNPKAIGIGGQSWGGYQTAYLVTQTNLFRAAVPNATVVNMTSAYGGIRWGTGISRSFQYERGQSRIGGSLWEYPERFIENSPLFHADRIQTPVLFMANDNDGAVPWYQGIEFFVAMRRLGKEAYMINYNGDEHNPTKRANQLDIDRKQLEFFDHHLRGAPKPAWMERGIPFLEKGRDQVRLAAPTPTPSAAPVPESGAGRSR